MFKSRLYVPGSRFCFWRWTFSHHNHRQPVTRLLFFRTPWLSSGLHWLLGPDADPYPHDHNMWLLSFVLRGGYLENRCGKSVWRMWFNFIRASQDDWHEIIHVLPHTLTLVFLGPEVRESGYHTVNGWVSLSEMKKRWTNIEGDPGTTTLSRQY